MAGRPRTFVEREVLDAAMQIFWRYGYEGASLAQLRAATGLSSASLYGAFGSKDGLFERAVEHYIEGPGRVTDVVGDESLGATEALRRMLHGSLDMQADASHPPGCMITLSATIGAEGPDESGARQVVAARRNADRLRIEICIRRGIETGELRADLPAEVMTALVHTFLLGASTQLCDGVDPAPLHASADLLLSGLGALN